MDLHDVSPDQFTSATETSISASMMSRTNWADRLNLAREIRSPKLTHMSAISSTVRPVTVTQRTWIPSLAIQMAHCVESSQCWNNSGSLSFSISEPAAWGTRARIRMVSETSQMAADRDETRACELLFSGCPGKEVRGQPMRGGQYAGAIVGL